MNSSYLIFIFLIIIIFISHHNNEKALCAYLAKKKGDISMQELAKRFIGKDVLINLISQGTVDGILTEVCDNAAVIEKDGHTAVINLDFVVRLREYPKNKNGKRKSIVAD